MALNAGLWDETVTEGGRAEVYGRVEEEEDASGHRQEKRGEHGSRKLVNL